MANGRWQNAQVFSIFHLPSAIQDAFFSILGARRVVKEVLVPVARQNEPESFVANQPFDRAVHSRHSNLRYIDVIEASLPGATPPDADQP
jgi:hypothetical protein